VAENPDFFKVGSFTTGGSWSHQVTSSLRKELLLDRCLGTEHRETGSLCLMATAFWLGNYFDWRPPWLGKMGRAPSDCTFRTDEPW
jgi:hypothetical protein